MGDDFGEMLVEKNGKKTRKRMKKRKKGDNDKRKMKRRRINRD
jgi:hypothetical protein